MVLFQKNKDKEAYLEDNNASISNKGWQVGGFYNFKFQGFFVKNELSYTQFSNYFQSENYQGVNFKNYRIDYSLLPAIRIKKFLDIHIGINCSLNLKRKTDLELIENMNFNKFNVGALIGSTFYTYYQINIDLSVEIPITKYEIKYNYKSKLNPLKHTPYLLKAAIGYCFNY